MQAVLMLPPGGSSKAEQWVAAGKSACAYDLAARLFSIDGIESVKAIVVEDEDHDQLSALGTEVTRGKAGRFEFGSALAEIIERENIKQLAYFGGASAPLLMHDQLAELIGRVKTANEPYAIANNLHSTDWILINRADIVASHSHRFPTDNPLGWVLSRETGVQVDSAAQSAATRLDIDTPTDLLMAWRHPGLGLRLRTFLDSSDPKLKSKIQSIQNVITTPASTLAIIGRASAHLWQRLVATTQIWVRLYVEERGMVASHRLAKGEVQSLIGQMMDLEGPDKFVDRLAGMADGVLWDTRVWMGTKPNWPTDADRFAADLGWEDHIEDESLRALTHAINSSPVPILAGGYGVVSGGLYALLESLEVAG